MLVLHQAEIEHAVEEVCSALPSEYKSLCDMLVEQYEPQIIAALLKKVPPKKLCSFIGLCSSSLLALQVQVIRLQLLMVDFDH